ncbi:MAG: ABC transporter ATP-binding protein [Clostridiales bacterium]|nr:ABC transporter ATP-binding protein [Clostridiales bacterium]
MINVRNLHKKFDRTQALDGIELTINRASIYGLVGTNGAGKTTLIRHMAGILKPDEGEILFDGEPVLENTALKQKIGLVPDELYFPKGYSISDMVRIYSGTYDNFNEERLHELTQLFRLDEKAPLKGFSKGMKKQAAIALALASMPEYLLLDEPIDGLDPIVRKLVWKQIVDDVADREMTVLVSSHNLRDLESICDYVGIIDDGKTVMERDLESIREGINKVQVAFAKDGEEAIEKLNVLHREKHGSVELIITRDSTETIEEVLAPANPLILDVLPLTLEEVFIYELGGEKYDFSEIM